MTLRTRLGNLGNILDEGPEQCEHLVLNSPVLTVPEWDALTRYLDGKAAKIDCSFENDGSDTSLPRALARIQAEAEEAVAAARLSDERRAVRNHACRVRQT